MPPQIGRLGLGFPPHPVVGSAVLATAPRAALDGKGPWRRPQKRLDKRLEEVAKAVGGGYCRLHMPLKLAFAVRETVAGHRLGTVGRGAV